MSGLSQKFSEYLHCTKILERLRLGLHPVMLSEDENPPGGSGSLVVSSSKEDMEMEMVDDVSSEDEEDEDNENDDAFYTKVTSRQRFLNESPYGLLCQICLPNYL